MILTVIAACEVAFWVLVGLALVLRYPLRRPRLGLGLLALVPVVDVVLLVAVALHLRSGGVATTAHSVATFYLGFSLAYGHRLVRWADVRFAHRFAGGPAPTRPWGREHTLQCWGDVRRTGLACLLACATTWALVAWTDDPGRTAALESGYRWAAVIAAVETIAALSYTVWPRSRPAQA